MLGGMDNIADAAVFHVSDPCTSQPLIDVREAAKRVREARASLCSALAETHKGNEGMPQAIERFSDEELLRIADAATKPYRIGTYKK